MLTHRDREVERKKKALFFTLNEQHEYHIIKIKSILTLRRRAVWKAYGCAKVTRADCIWSLSLLNTPKHQIIRTTRKKEKKTFRKSKEQIIMKLFNYF